MQMFFTFLGGLIEDKEFLLEEIESKPNDLAGISELFLVINCMSEISEERLTKKRIKRINKKLVDESISNIIYMRLNYEVLLDTLKRFSSFMNMKTFKYYLRISKDDENNEFYIRKDMIDTLKFISKANEKLENTLQKDNVFIDFERKIYLWEKNERLISTVLNKFNKSTLDNMLILSILGELEHELALENFGIVKLNNIDLEKDMILKILNEVVIEYISEWLNQNMEELTEALYVEHSMEHELIELLEKNSDLKCDGQKILLLLEKKEKIEFNLLGNNSPSPMGRNNMIE